MKWLILSLFTATFCLATPMDDYMSELAVQAKQENSTFTAFDSNRGKEVFTSEHMGKRGKKIACTSCHTVNLSQNGENIFTGKSIEPLSPKANNKRLTSVKEVKKWLRRNFKDVYNQEGTALQKGDVLTYIMNQ